MMCGRETDTTKYCIHNLDGSLCVLPPPFQTFYLFRPWHVGNILEAKNVGPLAFGFPVANILGTQNGNCYASRMFCTRGIKLLPLLSVVGGWPGDNTQVHLCLCQQTTWPLQSRPHLDT